MVLKKERKKQKTEKEVYIRNCIYNGYKVISYSYIHFEENIEMFDYSVINNSTGTCSQSSSEHGIYTFYKMHYLKNNLMGFLKSRNHFKTERFR